MKTTLPYQLWSDSKESVPTFYIHSFTGNGEEVWKACHQLQCPSFNLVSIHGIDLDAALSPWQAEGVWKGQAPFKGEAAVHLQRILTEVIPAVEAELPQPSVYQAMAGYSLAGLFTLWTALQTDTFQRVASISGSLWYPDFIPYLQKESHSFQPKCIYFSLGDKEKNTRHPLMKQVETCTQEAVALAETLQVPHVFEMNAGNHFTEPALRTAKAIYWLLNQ